jgi:hypothetical protein
LLRDGGETTAALRSYLQGLAQLGLVEGELQQAPWHGMAAAMQRVWRRAGWPPAGPSRDAFAMLLMRSLGWTGIAYVFTPDPQPLMRCNLLVDLVSRRVPGMAWARAVIWAGGASRAHHEVPIRGSPC